MADKPPEGPTDVAPETGIYTETLARLYLRQGFLDHAVAIYRHLAQEHPESQQLQAQLQALEQQLQQGGMELEPVLPQVAVQPPLCPRPPSYAAHVVIAQLERWLHYLQRQQPRHG